MRDFAIVLGKVLAEPLVDIADVGRIQGSAFPAASPQVFLVENQESAEGRGETTIAPASQPFIGNRQAAEIAVSVEPVGTVGLRLVQQPRSREQVVSPFVDRL